MMNTVKEKWPEIIEHLRVEHELSNVSFNTWIQPLKVYDVVDNTVFILVNMNASVEYIEKKYQLPLKVCIAEITGTEYEVVFISEDDDRLNEIQNMAIEANQKKKSKSAAEKAGLNPKYTFDTFVVGGNNNFAHAASLAVAESPGEVYNPLFLYGGVGLGKTHLMHSIAHFILDKNPKKKVLYVTSETFTNELIEALKNGKTAGNESAMSKFRDKYRNNDVLLIDDIQFIIGKESTQEEFFHTFNTLREDRRQIIISSDKPPRDIEFLEDRLKSRFEWGLLADISCPDYETRLAILRKKAQDESIIIDDSILSDIATKIDSNIRELEGVFNKIVARASLTHSPITIELAENIINEFKYESEKVISSDFIKETIAKYFSIDKDDLTGSKRSNDIAFPRQIAMYLCREVAGMSFPQIGLEFGNRDHSTVMHGYNKIVKEIKEKNSTKLIVESVQNIITSEKNK